MKEIRLFGAEKRSKTLEVHELGKTCLNRRFGEKSCLERTIFLWRISALLINRLDLLNRLRSDHRSVSADLPPYHKYERLFCGGHVQASSIRNPP